MYAFRPLRQADDPAATHWQCGYGNGDATVTVVMDEGGGHPRDELQAQAQHLQAAQRDALWRPYSHHRLYPGLA